MFAAVWSRKPLDTEPEPIGLGPEQETEVAAYGPERHRLSLILGNGYSIEFRGFWQDDKTILSRYQRACIATAAASYSRSV